MVVFDQLRISDDGKSLYIDAHINLADYFENAFIESITIMTADKVSETASELTTEKYIYKKTFEGDVKDIHLILGKADFDAAFINVDSEGSPIDTDKPVGKIPYQKDSFSNELFFVYVKGRWDGVPDECLPCSLTSLTTLGVTFDESILYQKVMDYTRQLADSCTIPQGFTDFILLWNAFKASVETEHFVPAIKYYNMIFGRDEKGSPYGPYGSYDSASGIIRKPCGCHG